MVYWIYTGRLLSPARMFLHGDVNEMTVFESYILHYISRTTDQVPTPPDNGGNDNPGNGGGGGGMSGAGIFFLM
jgi:hypothetical protein